MDPPAQQEVPPQGVPAEGLPPLRLQMIHAAQREIAQQARRRHIQRYGQPYNGRVRPRADAANLNINIYNNRFGVGVVEVEGGDQQEYGPVRFDEMMEAGRPLARLNPQRIPVPQDSDDSDGDGFGPRPDRMVARERRRRHMDDQIQDAEEQDEDVEVIQMDNDGPLVRERDYPYPNNFDELVVTPNHLDWSSRVVHMLNSRQHITWDACHICGMYCSSRWCNSCDQPVCLFHALVYQRPRGPQGQAGETRTMCRVCLDHWDGCHICGMYCSSRLCNSCNQPVCLFHAIVFREPQGQAGTTRTMCRVCVEANWDNVIGAIGFGGLVAQPGAPGHASQFGF